MMCCVIRQQLAWLALIKHCQVRTVGESQNKHSENRI